MNDKKDVVIAVLATVCLMSMLFAWRAYGAGIWPYNPWWDINDDGKIDIQDLARVSGAYATYGDQAKSVMIGNHTTCEWTDQKTIGYEGWWIINNATRGFSKVSLTVSISYNWHVYVYVSFINHGSAGDVGSVPDILNLIDVYTVSKTYEVSGSSIRIAIYNDDASPSISVTVGFYMTT